MEADNDGGRKPVFVVLSGGVPTISLDGLAFDEMLLNQIPISDGGWRSPDDVRADGGDPLADLMEVMDAIMAAHPDWTYHAIAIQSAPPFNDELMQYIATVGHGLFAAPNNLSDLEASLQEAIESSGCDDEPTPTGSPQTSTPTETPPPPTRTVTGIPETSTPTSTPTPSGAGFNGDYWAIFASDTMPCSAETTGPSTFVEVDPVFEPPSGFAFANVHSNGSFSVGNHSPIMGQVTYQDFCNNCYNALLLPEQESHELTLPDFDAYRELALSEALASGQHLTGDIVWGEPISDDSLPQVINDGIWYISGTLTIESDTWAVAQSAFVYVSGDVNIDGFFFAQNLSIILDGKINISGTLQNTFPFGLTHPNPLFQDNVAVLWSNNDLSETGTECTQPVINIDTTIINPLPPAYPSNNDIRGAILAPQNPLTLKPIR
jgi:hypothetical protein